MAEEIRTVAVIGAGISGVCTAAHLLRQGLSVTIYERMSIAGGVWHFDERIAHEQRYPNEVPSHGDYQRIEFGDEDVYDTPPRTPPERDSPSTESKSTHAFDDLNHMNIAHSSPGPCYVNLRNNVSLTAMKTSLGDWPQGLEEYVNQRHLEEYIQQIAQTHQVHKVTKYNTRVEDVRKFGSNWRVCTTTLVLPNQHPTTDGTTLLPLPHLKKAITFFDAVVVASGHYHMPRIPDISGLRQWKELFPERISHSKGYRDARKYRGSNVLIIGAGVSSVDIAKEIAAVGGTVYQSSRGGVFDLPATMLPEGAHRIAGVEAFVTDELNESLSPPSTEGDQAKSSDNAHPPTPIPGHVTLIDGTSLRNLHHIILATGYITSYPFLPTYHADTKTRHEALPTTLVTKEGDMVHNLHKDIFYIEDPTLSFVGVPYHISTFSLFDFQAQIVARVYSETSSTRVPSREDMRAEYEERVRSKGLGREFHSLRPEGAEIGYVAELVRWVNEGLRGNEEAMRGHSEAWLVAHREQRELLRRRFAGEV